MSGENLSELLNTIQFNGKMTEDDVLRVRRHVYGDSVITPAEADQMFVLNALSDKPAAWFDLFIEAITSFLVRQTMPHGYVSEANAMWLMARIDHDGVVETRSELELLLNVMKVADNVTEAMEAYALEQVKQAVIYGKGFVGRTRGVAPGQITDSDVELLRRVLYSASSQGGIGISRREAEALFELNDALGVAQNHPSWQHLFVRGIANHLMMLASWQEPDAEEALRREKWLERRGDGFIFPTFKGLGAAVASMFNPEPAMQFTHMNSSAVANAERVTAREAAWLIERLNKDGVLCENEKALLTFLREESPEISEVLEPYINAV